MNLTPAHPAPADANSSPGDPLPVTPDWTELLADGGSALLGPELLSRWLPARRWFAGKAKGDLTLQIAEAFPLEEAEEAARVLFVEARYRDHPCEVYFVPLQISRGAEARRIVAEAPAAVLARWGADAVLHDAVESEAFRSALFRLMAQGARRTGTHGELDGVPGRSLNSSLSPPASRTLGAEQSNSSILYGDQWFLKIYRKLEAGLNPDAELIRYLSERRGFPHVPGFCGALEFRRPGEEPHVLGLLAPVVANVGDAWAYSLEEVRSYYGRILASAHSPDPAQVEQMMGGVFPDRVRLLARRTGEMHLALASSTEDPAFAPEPFTSESQQALHASMAATTRRMVSLIASRASHLPENSRQVLAELPGREAEIQQLQDQLLQRPVAAVCTRTHGDYHLGQVLFTGEDFVIIDFEGEPARPLAERRMKRSPLRDFAGMLRSFHYAAYAGLWQGAWTAAERARLEPWAEAWAQRVSALYRTAYLETTVDAPFLPKEQRDLELLIQTHLLEKAAYEVVYELNNRPDWAVIPARGIGSLLSQPR